MFTFLPRPLSASERGFCISGPSHSHRIRISDGQKSRKAAVATRGSVDKGERKEQGRNLVKLAHIHYGPRQFAPMILY